MKKIIAIVIWAVAAALIGHQIQVQSVIIVASFLTSSPGILRGIEPSMMMIATRIITYVLIYFPLLLTGLVVYLGIRGRLWGTHSKVQPTNHWSEQR